MYLEVTYTVGTLDFLTDVYLSISNNFLVQRYNTNKKICTGYLGNQLINFKV